MKLAIVFLLSFVSLSYQYGYQKRWMSPYIPRYPSGSAHPYYNNKFGARRQQIINPSPSIQQDWAGPIVDAYGPYGASMNPSNGHWIFLSSRDNDNQQDREMEEDYSEDIEEENQQADANGFDQVQARARVRLPGRPLIPPQQRFFFGNKGVQFISNSSFKLPFMQTYATVTTSTVNMTLVSTCIPMNQFMAGGMMTCQRKKRRGAIERFLLSDEDDEISASEVQKIEATAVDFKSLEKRNADLNELISSSKDDIIIDNSGSVELSRQKRLMLNFDFTTTLTSYSFLTTVITKKLTLLSGTESSLLSCLPSGYAVCNAR